MKFINSIREDAVCRLASQHNGQRPCSVIRRDRGSFNVCFFVRFSGDAMTWVSEVTTMRYIERNITIPILHIHAYGEGAELTTGGSTTHAFLICDYISGQSLEQFYDDLINILAQLRKLGFPTAGSLMPNPDNESEPVVGGLLSMAANELQRWYKEQGSVKTFTSEKEYVTHQHDILSETYRLPTEDLSYKQAQMELFALDSLANQIAKLGFTGTVPRHLFTPPPWVTGHDLAAVAAISHDRIYPEFLEVLEAKSVTSSCCAKFWDDWKYLPDLRFPMTQIFHHPSSLIRFFFESQDIAKTLAVEVKHRIEESRRYTQYLKDQGLFIIDQQFQANQGWLAKVEQMRKT
ncbi:phosphotransferase [Ilyonectria destructans]|nr:phosphotransferase [Ilyonectria destructans]